MTPEGPEPWELGPQRQARHSRPAQPRQRNPQRPYQQRLQPPRIAQTRLCGIRTRTATYAAQRVVTSRLVSGIFRCSRRSPAGGASDRA